VIARHIQASTPKGQVVITPWDDFPGLFLFNRHNRYVVGLNLEFLRRADEKRFDAYTMLFSGRVDDPENLLPTFFGDAQLILVRTRPRDGGERALVEQLERSPHFARLHSPSRYWSIYSLDARAGASVRPPEGERGRERPRPPPGQRLQATPQRQQ
jgi:hypothetical protein